jgi:hypothetical protein
LVLLGHLDPVQRTLRLYPRLRPPFVTALAATVTSSIAAHSTPREVDIQTFSVSRCGVSHGHQAAEARLGLSMAILRSIKRSAIVELVYKNRNTEGR